MPRRAAPGDRDAIEQALPDGVHQALVESCALLGIPVGPSAESVRGWQGISAIQAYVETVAVLAEARRLMEEGMAETLAEREAAQALGVSWETVQSRLKRWCRASRETRETRVHNAPSQAREVAS